MLLSCMEKYSNFHLWIFFFLSQRYFKLASDIISHNIFVQQEAEYYVHTLPDFKHSKTKKTE